MSNIYDRIKDELVHHLPFIFRKKKEIIKSNIDYEFRERWKIISDVLGVEMESLPQFEISFEPINEASYFEKEKKIKITSYYIRKNEDERFRTIDHEIAHYIQCRKNPHLREKVSLPFLTISEGYWLLKGKLDKSWTLKAFKEGFAVYVASISAGKLSSGVQKVIDKLESGKRWKFAFYYDVFESLPYALGYLTYNALSKSESTKFAIELGLNESPTIWLEKGRDAFRKLKERCMV